MTVKKLLFSHIHLYIFLKFYYFIKLIQQWFRNFVVQNQNQILYFSNQPLPDIY